MQNRSTVSYHCSAVTVELGNCSSITLLAACGNSRRSAGNPGIRRIIIIVMYDSSTTEKAYLFLFHLLYTRNLIFAHQEQI